VKKWNRVLLIVPPTGKYIREERCQTPLEEMHTIALRPPMDLLYMAGSLELDGVVCKITDYPGQDLHWDDLRRELAEFKPDALVLSITTPTLADDVKSAVLAKEVNPEIVTVTKGAHFLYLDEVAMKEHPALDIVIRGEYEETIRVLASGSEWNEIDGITYRSGDQVIRNANRNFIRDINSIPYPARHLVDNGLYFRPDTGELQTTVVTSRGCPFTCVFCLAQPVSGAKVRNRTPENVVGELKECVEKYGIRNFLFRSDLFTANRKWVFELCDKIKEEGLNIKWACNSRADTIQEDLLRAMKDAGCWLIAFGVESGDPDMLEKMRKQLKFEKIEPAIRTCRKAGLKSSVYFLIGLPWENRETFDKSKKLARKLDPDFIEFFYSYPFYGTDFYREAVKEGLIEDGVLPKAAYNHPAIATKYLTIEQLMPLRKEALREFYLRPRYIIRTLLHNPSPTVLKNYFVYGLRQLRDLLT
jgi:anaerobic magnesium-protoporphyrin IX monomethyl ester cyclase